MLVLVVLLLLLLLLALAVLVVAPELLPVEMAEEVGVNSCGGVGKAGSERKQDVKCGAEGQSPNQKNA